MPTLPGGTQTGSEPVGPDQAPGPPPGPTRRYPTFDFDWVPAAADHAAIAAIVHRLKEKVWTRLPEVPPDQLDQTWSLIEEMARQLWRPVYQRWLLLSDPFALSDNHMHRRHFLISEYWLQRTQHGPGRRSLRRYRPPISILW